MEKAQITPNKPCQPRQDTPKGDFKQVMSSPPTSVTGGSMMGSFALPTKATKPLGLALGTPKQTRRNWQGAQTGNRGTPEGGANPFSLLCPYCRSPCNRRKACKEEWEAHQARLEEQKQLIEQIKNTSLVKDADDPQLARNSEVSGNANVTYAEVLKVNAQLQNLTVDANEDFENVAPKLKVPVLKLNGEHLSHKDMNDMEAASVKEEYEDIHPALKCSYMGRFAAGADKVINESITPDQKEISKVKLPKGNNFKKA
ncbi:hypothetical protein EDC01DRAFT_746947 [Geopyxis carbonaria]|nr:hypothetical protein EDC01DRAFT_746947 [Geopyxis carbonaria]